MKPSFAKKLAFVAILCMLALGIVPAHADCTIACCGQSDSHDSHIGFVPNNNPMFPGCSASLENSPCYFLSDLTFEVRESAILPMPRGRISTSINLATAADAAFTPLYLHQHFVSPPRLLTMALNVPLYLRNLSLLI